MNAELAKQLLRFYFYCLLFVAASYILGASYLGTNGHQAWRQADVYSHILGFQGKQGLRPLDNFFGKVSPYDFPIYTYLVAKLSTLLDSDPLVVVRNVNFLAFMATWLIGFRLTRHFFGLPSAVIYLSLLGTSRLVLHYFSVPLPDVMAIALSLFGFSTLLLRNDGFRVLLAALALFVAALIKSPVAFPFVVCLILMAITCRKRSGPIPQGFSLHVAIASALALVGAVLSELWRSYVTGLSAGLVNGAAWYFGSLDLRLSEPFRLVFWDRLGSWGPPIFPYLFLLVAGLPFLGRVEAFHRKFLVALLVSFILPWLIFANLYFIHDYYQLPVVIIAALFLAGTGGILYRVIVEATSLGRWVAVGLATAFFINQTALLIAAPFSERARTSRWTAMEHLIPEGEQVLVAGDSSYGTPIPGGKLGRRIVEVKQEQLESNCNDYLMSYSVVVSAYPSHCLQEHKSQAESFFTSAAGMLLIHKR